MFLFKNVKTILSSQEVVQKEAVGYSLPTCSLE